ncbi:MAG TPA: ATP-binding protein, partial [Opitutus sp.]|nr:ATP-binding protein [Opitutus sp.]
MAREGRLVSTSAQVGSVTTFANPGKLDAVRSPRVRDLFTTYEQQVFARTHRLFLWLLPAQWIFALVIAAWWSPRGAAGSSPLTVAMGVGALLTLPAFAAIRWMPHHLGTRITVTLAQLGFSALLILLTGGRVETHFHIFGSMAFLALYRDWRVLPVATATIFIHHFVLGYFWPASIYCEPTASVWRSVEHAGWVLFENAVLFGACLISRREMAQFCHREDELRTLHGELELRVVERTRDLEAEMQARERTAAELQRNEEQHRNLIANVPIGIFKTTRSGKVIFANPYLLGLIGLPAEFDSMALSLADGQIFALADRNRLWTRLEQEKEVRGFAATFKRFDGSSFEVVINAQLKETPPGADLVCEGTLEDVTVRKRAECDLDTLHSQLVIASRQAGMAEVAAGVLHNVGNVLTSVNLIVHDVQDRLKTTRLSHLRRVVEILQREQPRLVEFLSADSSGRQLPDFLAKLDDHLTSENRQLLSDVEGLVRHFEHIREIIVTQQGSAQLFGVLETLTPTQLFEDALRLNAESLDRHGISLERVFEPTGHVQADRHKVLQILVNLLKNAKDALQAVKPGERVIRVRVAPASDTTVQLAVEDNGPGILEVNLTRIFQHGFTTKPTGHGFGLHS